MTSKERAAWRSKANALKPLFQIGKEGVKQDVITQTESALTARELIKIRVLLETSPVTPREAAEELSVATGSEVIQVVGGSIVLYRYNPELHKKVKKKVKPRQNVVKVRFTKDKGPRGKRATATARGKRAK